MSVCDEKLKKALLEVWEKEDARLEEEIKQCEPHVFSREFEQKMNQLLNNHGRECAPHGFRQKLTPFWKPLAAVVVVCIMISGILLTQSSSLRASALRIDILEWLDEFFTVEDGNVGKTEDNILFEESQIGYLPAGFEKVNEELAFSQVQLEYQGSEDEYIKFRIYKGKTLSTVDNESAKQEVHVNDAGYEYTIVYRDDSEQITVLWKDEQEICYYLISSLEEQEIINIMNSISYIGRK